MINGYVSIAIQLHRIHLIRVEYSKSAYIMPEIVLNGIMLGRFD